MMMGMRTFLVLVSWAQQAWTAATGGYPDGKWPTPKCDQKYVLNAEIVCTEAETFTKYWGEIDHCMDYTLHWFATTGNTTEIQRLLSDCGKDVNALDDTGVTALWTAAVLGHYQIVEQLLNNSADICVIGYHGYNLLQAAKDYFCYWHRLVGVCGRDKFKWIPLDYQKTIDILERECKRSPECKLELDAQKNKWLCCPKLHKPCALAKQPGVRLNSKTGEYEHFNVRDRK